MTQDEVIRMAVQCQLVNTSNREGIYMDALQSFAKLVAAKEREACAKVCEDINAKHITEFGDYFGSETYATDCAEAIRARGEA